MEYDRHGQDPRGDAHADPSHEGHGARPHGKSRCGGRLTAYFLMLIVLNLLLAVYALYAVGLSMELDGTAQLAGASRTVTEMFFQILLLLSPLLLTLIVNRILYRLFRGRRVFPRGTWILAILVILLVQVVTICSVLRYGRTDDGGGFTPLVTQIESLAEEAS